VIVGRGASGTPLAPAELLVAVGAAVPGRSGRDMLSAPRPEGGRCTGQQGRRLTVTTHPDTFAALLGVALTRPAPGVAEASLTVAPYHLNPHGTAHGALLYSVGGVALAAAANDAHHSGMVSAVHVDYLSPARMGDRLVARAEVSERMPREDLFTVRVVRAGDGELVARLSGRASRRVRDTGQGDRGSGPRPPAGAPGPAPRERFATQRLPAEPDVVAPDGSDVRVLLRLGGGSMAHFELGPGRTSAAVRHRTVEEIWYVLGGTGRMWRREPDGPRAPGPREEVVALAAGTCLTIPSGTAFQFRADGEEPLRAVGVTMPPWPDHDEAIPVKGPWPTV